ncbi:MAG: hypothetical protein AB9866_04340 [Syntrophobacteraceae bacterium]
MTRCFRQRVENCITTVLELDRCLGEGQIRPEIIRQFERLKTFVRVVSDETTDEVDIGKIEEATKQLLDEIKSDLQSSGIEYRFRGETN